MNRPLDNEDIARLIHWVNDPTMGNLDKATVARLVNALVTRLTVYQEQNTPLQQVVNFNYSNPKRRLTPAIMFGTEEELTLAWRLLDEELQELRAAIAARKYVEAVDALLDLEYVLLNAAAAHGLHTVPGLWEALFQEVHRSNMSKFFADGTPHYRGDGKLLKGPNYFPPDLEAILMSYGWNRSEGE